MAKQKIDIVKSILRFLHDEIESTKLDMDQKESLEVAKQCLESTYDIDSADNSIYTGSANLFNLFNVNTEVSAEVIRAAEELKVGGNNFMKMGRYSDALDVYTEAINLNPKNHVFYCNRAAAYSRLEKHWDAIADCKKSIKLQPTAKAYGRLGVAYSNMSMYQDAKDAYAKAHELDPSNPTYEQNLKLADELLTSQPSSGAQAASSLPNANAMNFNNFLNNPALISTASQMLSDPAFVNMVSGLMSTGPNGDPNIDGFLSVTQQLAQQIQAANSNLIESLRQSMNAQDTESSGDSTQQDPGPQNNQ
ncbi:putative homodimerisation domain of SGTA [Trypoxylus dichotomus]